MTIPNWNQKIKFNFNKAANHYTDYSFIQQYFSKKIICILKDYDLQKGNYYDLGSGTGFLADLIEKEFPFRKCTRVDMCQNMLSMNTKHSEQILWDLNDGLPPYINNAALFVSNFFIHWLNKPEKIMKECLNYLMPGGYLIISYPTNRSFPEWKATCKKNKIEYSGLNLPNPQTISNAFLSEEIHQVFNYSYKEDFQDIFKLFRNMINIGAHSSHSKRKTVTELRKLNRSWPKDINNKVNLTWNISILVIKKL